MLTSLRLKYRHPDPGTKVPPSASTEGSGTLEIIQIPPLDQKFLTFQLQIGNIFFMISTFGHIHTAFVFYGNSLKNRMFTVKTKVKMRYFNKYLIVHFINEGVRVISYGFRVRFL